MRQGKTSSTVHLSSNACVNGFLKQWMRGLLPSGSRSAGWHATHCPIPVSLGRLVEAMLSPGNAESSSKSGLLQLTNCLNHASGTIQLTDCLPSVASAEMDLWTRNT